MPAPEPAPGEPVTLLVPVLPAAGDLLPYLREIDRGHRYTNFGPLAGRLSARLAKLVGAPWAVTLSSATAGLELALAALALPAGSKVMLPSRTFPATATAVLRAGHLPLFCDVDERTGILTPELARRALEGNGAGAVIPVCLFGWGYAAGAWEDFSRDTGLPVVIDAAGAIGHQPAAATATVYSLHATKPLSTGEGGIVATADPELADKVLALTNFGFARGAVSAAGTNAKLSEYNAAVGLASLDLWPAQAERRRRLLGDYEAALSAAGAYPHVEVANGPGIAGNLSLRFGRPISPADLEAMKRAGIEVRRWYHPPLHRMPLFAAAPLAGMLDATEFLAAEVLGIPFHLRLTADQIGRVAAAVAGLFR